MFSIVEKGYIQEFNSNNLLFGKENARLAETLEAIRGEQTRTAAEHAKCVDELTRLRTYVNDSMPTIETVAEMAKEQRTLEERLSKAHARNDMLVKENAAIQTRLKAINEILAIQECQLESSSSSSTTTTATAAATSLMSSEKKRAGLLARWRHKCYELLVQLKTEHIVSGQERHAHERTIHEYAHKLGEQAAANRILANVVDDRTAELTQLGNDKSALGEELSVLRSANAQLERQRADDLQSTRELTKFVAALQSHYEVIEESFRAASRKLTHLDQRVEFAKNRLGLVQTLYASRSSNSNSNHNTKPTTTTAVTNQPNLLDMTANISSIHGSLGLNDYQSHQHQQQQQQQQQQKQQLQLQPSHSSVDHLQQQHHKQQQQQERSARSVYFNYSKA